MSLQRSAANHCDANKSPQHHNDKSPHGNADTSPQRRHGPQRCDADKSPQHHNNKSPQGSDADKSPQCCND
eukprot:8108439-Prorocentrum_lima.AAC.1